MSPESPTQNKKTRLLDNYTTRAPHAGQLTGFWHTALRSKCRFTALAALLTNLTIIIAMPAILMQLSYGAMCFNFPCASDAHK